MIQEAGFLAVGKILVICARIVRSVLCNNICDFWRYPAGFNTGYDFRAYFTAFSFVFPS